MEAGGGEVGDEPEPPEPGGAAVVDPEEAVFVGVAARRPRPAERTLLEERALLDVLLLLAAAGIA